MKTTLLIIWMVITAFLCVSVIGLILFIPKDNYIDQDSTPSTWMQIGRDLLESVLKD